MARTQHLKDCPDCGRTGAKGGQASAGDCLRCQGSGLLPDHTVDHPPHYNAHPSGVECIDIAEHLTFNVGNAVKYLWRHEGKNGLEDLRKAAWYVEREIKRLSREPKPEVRNGNR